MSKSDYKLAVAVIKERVGEVDPALLERIKKETKIKNMIKKSLKGSNTDISKAKTIPQIAEECQISAKEVTYHLATFRKYALAEEIPERNKEFLKWKLKDK